MKNRGLDNMIKLMVLILCVVLTAWAVDSYGKKCMSEALLKQKLAKPTPEWITQHGDGLRSVEIFNIASLIEIERKRQAVVK